MYLLYLETSSKNCSVSISRNNELLCCCEEEFEDLIHNKKLHLFIKYALEGSKIFINNIQGVCINSGPGSYTGLRVAAATAKGLSYCLNIPLIAINSINIIIEEYINNLFYDVIIPIIDAHSMGVYIAIFDINGKMIEPIHLLIFKKKIFKKYRNKKILIVGSGVKKIQKFIESEKLSFSSIVFNTKLPSSRHMINLGVNSFKNNIFQSINSFEPNYLKDFFSN